MSSLIFQLIITFAFYLMTQSSPIYIDPTVENQKVHERSLFCAARSLYNAVGQLRKASYTLPHLPTIDINNNTEEFINSMYHDFSERCQYFTTTMTLKHQLQDHLFINADTALDFNAENIEKFSTILTSLQTMADTFNNMEFNKENRRCEQFTPVQYQIMYYVLYTSTTPLLKSLKDDLEGWYRDSGLYEYPDVLHC